MVGAGCRSGMDTRAGSATSGGAAGLRSGVTWGWLDDGPGVDGCAAWTASHLSCWKLTALRVGWCRPIVSVRGRLVEFRTAVVGRARFASINRGVVTAAMTAGGSSGRSSVEKSGAALFTTSPRERGTGTG